MALNSRFFRRLRGKKGFQKPVLRLRVQGNLQ